MPRADQRVSPPAGKGRCHQATKGVARTPQPQHPPALLRREETAEVFAQPRPAGGLRQPLDQHATDKNRQGGKGAHHHRRCGRNQQSAQHHHPWPEAVRQHAPGELPHGIGRQVQAIKVGHHHFVEGETGVIDDAQLGHRKRFASEIERGVRQPGDGENLHAPTLDATRLDIHCGSDLR